MIYSFVKCGCSVYFFLNSANLICRGKDIFFFFFFDLGFMALSRIFHLYRADRSSKVGENRRTPEKNHLTIRKQNLAFPHMTRARLEPQR